MKKLITPIVCLLALHVQAHGKPFLDTAKDSFSQLRHAQLIQPGQP